MAQQPIEDLAPGVAATLRAVYRVSRAAGTAEQRAAASRVTNRWTVLALDAGWTTTQIAAVVGQHHSVVARRGVRQRELEPTMPPLVGILDVTPSPRYVEAQAEARRRQLISAGEIAQLVGVEPASVAYWATARSVGHEWSPGGGRRLYDRGAVLTAAERKPTVVHKKHRPRSDNPRPPRARRSA